MMAAVPHQQPADWQKPRLELSGEKLRLAVDALVRGCEDIGGVERLVAAVQLKSEAFKERLGSGAVHHLDIGTFEELVPLMATVRSRIGRLIEAKGWTAVQEALVKLLADGQAPESCDERLMNFCKSFPSGKETRFVRDLASEILHNTFPEHYPLMSRWVWDSRVNTGVIREIWHAENIDNILIDVPDNQATFLCLREELSQYLSDNGIFRDMVWYVDVLCAQIYGGYINAQGGAYLRSDFSSAPNPLEQTYRILGLDRVSRPLKTGKVIESEAYPSAAQKFIH
ncbi:MAG: hypothetical protein JSR78_09915 [Proteobacteria bacterium]|nr:hypothetical protein [Pseudomonadota bacterium]